MTKLLHLLKTWPFKAIEIYSPWVTMKVVKGAWLLRRCYSFEDAVYLAEETHDSTVMYVNLRTNAL